MVEERAGLRHLRRLRKDQMVAAVGRTRPQEVMTLARPAE